MVKKSDFAALVAAVEPDILNYFHNCETGEQTHSVKIDEHGNYTYFFEWVDSGEGMVKVIFLDCHGDQLQWDTEVIAGGSDVWAPFDVALATMWAVLQAEKLHKEKFPESGFSGEYEGCGSII